MVGVATWQAEPFNVCRQGTEINANVLNIAWVSWWNVANPDFVDAIVAVSVTACCVHIVYSDLIHKGRRAVAADGD